MYKLVRKENIFGGASYLRRRARRNGEATTKRSKKENDRERNRSSFYDFYNIKRLTFIYHRIDINDGI